MSNSVIICTAAHQTSLSFTIFGSCSNSYPLSWWCHPTVSSVTNFCLQSLSASGSFPMSQLFLSSDESIGASSSVLPMNIQDWSPLELTGLISLLSKGLSRVLEHHNLKAAILQCPASFMVQLLNPCKTTGKTIALLAKWCLLFNTLSRFIIAFFQEASMF